MGSALPRRLGHPVSLTTAGHRCRSLRGRAARNRVVRLAALRERHPLTGRNDGVDGYSDYDRFHEESATASRRPVASMQ
jgi:hypothetical protein